MAPTVVARIGMRHCIASSSTSGSPSPVPRLSPSRRFTGSDAGSDAGSDTGSDAGIDAGPPDEPIDVVGATTDEITQPGGAAVTVSGVKMGISGDAVYLTVSGLTTVALAGLATFVISSAAKLFGPLAPTAATA